MATWHSGAFKCLAAQFNISISWSVLQTYQKKSPKESAINYRAKVGSQDESSTREETRDLHVRQQNVRFKKKNKAAANILSSHASVH